MTFDEYDREAQEIGYEVDIFLTGLCVRHKIHLKSPKHDIARRFFHEIVEFKPLDERDKNYD